MITFKALIKKFDEKGEKTGWTYVEVPAELAEILKPGNKKGFRVKGRFDDYTFDGLSLLPMGGGDFILPLNATHRKAIRKQKGAIIKVELQEDELPYALNADLVECINDEPGARAVFEKLPTSHKNYYSKWVDNAKSDATKTRRIAMVVSGLAAGLDYGGMLRKAREEKKLLGR